MAVHVSADATLDNLVAQFARPMDCLRELVQNAMDAGTPRVDVWLAYRDGVLEIHVDDAGGGMDEAIIDKQLTKLFSSTKEGDRTKIGKFGIGFSSIFAIQPDAVLLRTGRHGENWELVFHPDRSFDKAAIDEPVRGTQITLFKRMAERDVAGVVVEARDVLAYWCEHATTPITFSDHTQQVVEAAADPHDPFAAFAEPAAGPEVESISGPLALETVVQVGFEEGGIEALVGVGRQGSGPFGFYNGGLTLVSSPSPEVLGDHAASLGHLTFKVRCDQLEHTLTRDNVLQDETFDQVLAAIDLRRAELVAVAVAALEAGEADTDRLMDFLVAEHRVRGALPAPASQVVLRDHQGRPWTLEEVLAQGARFGALLVEGPVDPDLAKAMEEREIRLLPDRSWVRGLAGVAAPTGWFGGRSAWTVRRPRDLFVQPDVREAADGPEAELMDVAGRLLASAPGSVVLRLGAFDEGLVDPELVVVGPAGGDLFLRRSSGWRGLVEALGWRQLVINGEHPFVRSQVLAAERDPVLAAQGLLLVVLHEAFDRVQRGLAQHSLVEVRR